MSGEKIGPGRLVAVVGPSGSGKDSIMRAARDLLASDERVVFPRRVITRQADIHEDHIPISEEDFRQAETNGAYTLSWRAHGLSYGIARDADVMIRNGSTVILNVSRTIVPLLRERYRNLTVIAVSVDALRLAQRLASRGRETQAEIQHRIARAGQEKVTGADVVEIDNSGPLQDAVHRFVQTIAPHLTTGRTASGSL